MSDTPAAVDAADVAAIIHQRLGVLAPIRLELIDDSARHAGHAGARGGGRHYRLLIVAPVFAGQARLARHRRVIDALGDLMHTRIHALSIQALTPAEVP
ncbi:BolA family protein [Accumulibacter sp.]|uniref:BolA family protein n=1 Tax=Accumulibacter sp. TaxID=2053492 RepID=UPI002580E544|nr:BolA family protein [Accumulibacter sp.]